MDCLLKKRCKGKRQKVKNSILDGPLIVNVAFSNMLLPNQILLILCIFIKQNVWYSWSLKIFVIKRWFPFNFTKILHGRLFAVGGPKNFKLLTDISLHRGLSSLSSVAKFTIIFVCLLMRWSRRYSIKWSINFDGQ